MFVLVVADNCTDNTAEVALAAGAQVHKTVDNHGLCAGAINQGLRKVLPRLYNDDAILILDADTTLAPNFIREAEPLLDRNVGGVTGVVRGRPNGWFSLLQSMEYARAERSRLRSGRVDNLSGAGTLYRVDALKDILDARGEVFLSGEITQDFELTLALRSLDWSLVCCEAEAYTEMETTISGLWRQRMRWQLGGLGVLRRYGWHLRWWHVWWSQLLMHMSVLLFMLVAVLYGSLIFSSNLHFQPLWLLLFPFISLDQLVTTWKVHDWRARVLAISALPLAVYAVGQAAIYACALAKYAFGRRTVAWGASLVPQTSDR